MEEILAMNWKCYDCNMTFTNPNLLQKHKSRFCVGGQLGDPDHLMLRKSYYKESPREDVDVPEVETARYNPSTDPKIQLLAESHGRQMQYLQDRNKELERQREEIRRRLEELGKRPIKDDGSMDALLRELREQEARNQKMLEELRRQLMQARYIPPTENKKHPFIYPVYYGNSLVAEITAMRQAYLQNGGNDPDILHQLAQMQAEAQAIDDSLRNRPAPAKDKRDPGSLHALELENERLQRQLSLLQEQNLAAKHRRKGDREGRQSRHGVARTLIEENANKPVLLDTENTNNSLALDSDKATKSVTAEARLTPVDPLNINEKELLLNKEARDKKAKAKKDFISPRRAWLDHFDPLKVRIDKDVGNTAFKVSGRLWDGDDEESEGDLIDKTKVKRATLLNEPTQDVVTGVPNKPPENPNIAILRRNIPYFKRNFPSRKLKLVDKDSRNYYFQTSQPSLRPADVERLDLLSAIREASRANTAASANEFIPRSQRVDEGKDLTQRSNGTSRPQLIVESNIAS